MFLARSLAIAFGCVLAASAVAQDGTYQVTSIPLGSFLITPAQAQVGCVPNPNAGGPPFVNGCAVPASGLNAAAFALGNVGGYLAVGQPDGTTDNSVGVNKAVTALCAVGGGVLYFGPGHWKVHDINMACPVLVAGAGKTTTNIDYTAATNYGFQWQVAGFPAFKSGAHAIGGGIQDLTMNYTGTPGTATAINVEGFQDWRLSHVSINAPYNGIFGMGVEHADFRDLYMGSTTHTDINFFGDLTGQTASGAACTTSNGDCSTRSDFIAFHDVELIDNLQTNTCFNFQGFVATIMADHTACEGSSIGLSSTCQVGLAADLSQCPHFFFLADMQFEFWKTTGLVFQDTIDVKFDKPYSYGANLGTAANALSISTLNYGSTTGCSGGQCTPPGKMKFSHGLFFSTQNDCVLVKAAASTLITDISLDHNDINGCNGSNGGFGAISVAPSGASVTQGHIDGNSLCQASGFSSSNVQAYGINYGANATNFASGSNTMFACGVPIINASATNYDFGSDPPPSFGTITEADGHLGASGTIAGSGGNALGGSITLSPSGAGITAVGNPTMTLPANVTMRPGMLCTFTLGSGTGTWAAGATVQSISSNTTSVTFSWNNNGTALTTGSTYGILYRCNGY